MANPFLFEDVADYSEPIKTPFNPFLCGGDEPVDNPFLTSVSSAPGTNPFADYSWEEPAGNVTGLLTPPVISNINDPENDFVVSSDEESSKPTAPMPHRPSLAKETHDLILSVTGALKATSDDLLERIPPTRAPSPTCLTELHSPSPTPDLLGGEINLLGMPQQPPRPPPPRPPTRPAPPTLPPAPKIPPAQPEIDLFGTPSAPLPKSKDAILNLYSQPKPPPDLLSGELDAFEAPPLISDCVGVALIDNNQNITSSETAAVEPLKEQNDSKELTPVEPPVISVIHEKTPSPVLPVVKEISPQNAQEESEENIELQSSPNETNQGSPVADEITPTVIPESVPSPPHKMFGVIDEPDTNESFGVAPVESKLFGVSSPQDSPQIFGVPAPEPVPLQNEYSIPQNSTPIFGVGPPVEEFGTSEPKIFGVGPPPVPQRAPQLDAFDAFSAKFDEVSDTKKVDPFDVFGGTAVSSAASTADAWGSSAGTGISDQSGFDGDSFDAFLSMNQPPLAQVGSLNRAESAESEEKSFNVFIKPREGESYAQSPFEAKVPSLAPPPQGYPESDPFDKNGQIPAFPTQDGFSLPPLSQTEPYEGGFKRTDSQETPPTPLFDEDVSQPLEEFPRIHYSGDGWEMQLRHPNKKKITGQRFWKRIFVKLVYQGDNPVLQLFNLKEDKDPFQELPLQACYSVSEISAQQYDQFGKIFTVKLQYIFYKERPGVRPGQVTKAERITNKLSQFAAYAIQGDYQGVKEFGSDLKKLGLPVEHAPQVSQLLKLGCMSYEDLKQFSVTIEECLFRMPVHRDRALTYKMEEVQITVVDEIYVEQDAFGHVDKQIARVRLFFLAFLSGMPDVELGVNDLWRQGKEVVGRHDIIPVVTEEWIRLEGVEFHSCIQVDEYERTRTIKFKPPDACYIELMRFRIRPPKNRELPLQLKAVFCVTGNKVELRADVLVPGFTSRKLGQIPCEDVMIRFPIPECWIYMFRVEKHFRYGSVKSAHRRTGKIKGIERFLGAVENLEPSLIEVTSGQAKYEHQHRAIVWRMPRLPKEGQGAYTTHNLVCRMQLASYDQIPENLAEYAYVEFTMPATTASHTTVRSVSLVDSPSDDPPEKYVRQLARMEYRVGIEHTQGEEMASYIAATVTKPAPAPAPQETAPSPMPADSDTDSSD